MKLPNKPAIVALLAILFSGTIFAQLAGSAVGMLNNQLSSASIEFKFDEWKFTDPSLIQKMDTVAPTIKSITSQIPAGYSLFIIGHSSSEGQKKYNQTLSDWRARSVYYRLIRAGVDEKLMEWIGVQDSQGSKREVTFEIRKYPNN